ncbi:phage/plasmid primase, P4 family [Gordonia alkanivorans]|uniref:DNA primase family protein n=1 Tax=Gordonia alkanivorans TaxID=84096 RepID=UPI00244B7422|nr:phage/plasmid primase, P4 family [Gordonia alkanivorans]MDH3049746.1 phage/plasmid primase, P4 family [Gordonia alkanivorans]
MTTPIETPVSTQAYPGTTYATARRLTEDGHLNGWTERDGSYWQWTGRAYERRDERALNNYLGSLLEDPNVTGCEWKPTRSKVRDVIQSLTLTEVPAPDADVLALDNGLFDPISGTLVPPTPTRFITNALPYPYNPDATCPQWMQFLDSVWSDEPECIAMLQEWVGYLVSGRTNEQKALLMIGPTRAGKGVILRVVESLMGSEAVGALSMNNLTSWFGMQTVIGKRLAVIGDLRIGRSLSVAAQENLLSTTGEDVQNIQRKGAGLEPISIRLRCRIMGATNVEPQFSDSAGVLPQRFLYLKFTRSFSDHVDKSLGDKLSAELPGILNWALAGWRRLADQGGFTLPASHHRVLNDVAASSSPEARFIEECCDVADPEATTAKQLLYVAWREWAKERGHHPGTDSQFGAALKAQFNFADSRPRQSNGGRTWSWVGVRLR